MSDREEWGGGGGPRGGPRPPPLPRPRAPTLLPAGIAFVGPRPETIDAMGDKTAARAAATACGVPIVPGTAAAVASADEAATFSDAAGYPVILKAAMGGGGRGMRVVRARAELAAAFATASSEAAAAFGDGRMFVEKYVEDPR